MCQLFNDLLKNVARYLLQGKMLARMIGDVNIAVLGQSQVENFIGGVFAFANGTALDSLIVYRQRFWFKRDLHRRGRVMRLAYNKTAIHPFAHTINVALLLIRKFQVPIFYILPHSGFELFQNIAATRTDYLSLVKSPLAQFFGVIFQLLNLSRFFSNPTRHTRNLSTVQIYVKGC